MKVTERKTLILTKNTTKEIIVLDGVKIELEAADLDQDGITGGVEKVKQTFDPGIQTIVQPTELGDTLKELNKDDLEEVSRMSGIDMRARLKEFEVSSVLALDALVSLGVLPTECLAFTRQKKRLSVSIEGKGRQEIVELVAGKRDLDAKAGMGFMDKGKNFMGLGR